MEDLRRFARSETYGTHYNNCGVLPAPGSLNCNGREADDTLKTKWLVMSAAWTIGFGSAIPARLAGQTANPVPLINQPVHPEAHQPGGSGFSLAVTGTGFGSGAVVLWNGGPLPTKFAGVSLLTALVPAAKIAEAGTASIEAVNPGPGRVASRPRFLEVRTPAARVSLGIASYPAGSDPTSVTEGDFNRDGKLDLATASVDLVGIFFGNGDGTFQQQVAYAAGSSVRDVTVPFGPGCPTLPGQVPMDWPRQT